jgi:hypothetical protein
MVLDHAAQQKAFAEAKLLDHRARHKRICAFTSEIRGRVTQKAVTVGVHFQYPRSGHQGQWFATIRIIGFARILVAVPASVVVIATTLSVGGPTIVSATITASAATSSTATTTARSLTLVHFRILNT